MSPIKPFSGWDTRDWFETAFRLFFSALVTLPVPVVLNLLPDLDTGREEARRIQTWNETRRIASEISSSPEEAINKAASQKDIWGNPYRLEVMPDGKYRVSTPGRDGVYDSPDKEEADDIHSDLKSAPTEVFRQQRRKQWIFAFAVWAFSGATIFLLLQRRAMT